MNRNYHCHSHKKYRFFVLCFLTPTTVENTLSKISHPFLRQLGCNQYNSIALGKTIKPISTNPSTVHGKKKKFWKKLTIYNITKFSRGKQPFSLVSFNYY